MENYHFPFLHLNRLLLDNDRVSEFLFANKKTAICQFIKHNSNGKWINQYYRCIVCHSIHWNRCIMHVFDSLVLARPNSSYENRNLYLLFCNRDGRTRTKNVSACENTFDDCNSCRLLPWYAIVCVKPE